ncbi:MAG: Transposase [Candidatus Daviesbacteria bacterium GW2011_GWB1_36_5]|uniref:Transposase n=3 Tax=Patescibacteria group TaxID=1783273 RepID=A0A0G0HTA8_9BACT|nr:MAG: Transposase [Candidatus Nomurabacteria bacterium GW2011_GWA1_35_8]KKQ07096.1 MAG: Transposase [Candidatus Daviesbacteria bacterium GW2011_GWB1_36_5]
MERKEQFIEEEFYHIYNRGVEKRVIFQNISDYKRFMALLYLTNSDKTVEFRNNSSKNSLDKIFKQDRGKQLVAIGAYCLMPNHFHLLITPLVDGGISKFMLKLQTGYSMYFNKKNERVGALFQGVFQSQHINKDKYLRYIYAYIHLNPAKLKNPSWKTQPKSFLNQLKKFIAEYPYSSLQEYVSLDYKIVNSKLFPVNKREICNYNTIIDDFSEENNR